MQGDFDRDDSGWSDGEVPGRHRGVQHGRRLRLRDDHRPGPLRTSTPLAGSLPSPPPSLTSSASSTFRATASADRTPPAFRGPRNGSPRSTGASAPARRQSGKRRCCPGGGGRSGVPLTIVNPSTVIGDSHPGSHPHPESGRTVLDLIGGRMPALPEGARLRPRPGCHRRLSGHVHALLPTRADTTGESCWVLD